MTLRQCLIAPTLLDRKSPRSIRALQVLETIDRDPARASRELQQTTFLLGVPFLDGFPEPPDHLVGFLVAAVIGVFLPIVDIDVCYATDEELELTFIEDVD